MQKFRVHTCNKGLLFLIAAGKRAFIAGIADDNGYGWAIAKSLAAAGAEILVGTWVPVRISLICL